MKIIIIWIHLKKKRERDIIFPAFVSRYSFLEISRPQYKFLLLPQ